MLVLLILSPEQAFILCMLLFFICNRLVALLNSMVIVRACVMLSLLYWYLCIAFG